MVEQTPHYRSYEPDIDLYDENTADQRPVPYRLRHLARTDSYPEDSVPLFLSDGDGEPDPSEYITRSTEYITPSRKARASISSRILAGVLAAAAAAILFALFSSDATRDIIVNAKASIAASLPAPYAAVQPDPAQL